MIQISDKDRELLGKLDCEDDFWLLLEKQFRSEVDTNAETDSVYWPKKAGYTMARLHNLLAAIRTHEETE